jgi:hypothetical protein
MEAELEKIPFQIGTAVLDASDGRIVKVSTQEAAPVLVYDIQIVAITVAYLIFCVFFVCV